MARDNLTDRRSEARSATIGSVPYLGCKVPRPCVIALAMGAMTAGAPLACASSSPNGGEGARPPDPPLAATAPGPAASAPSPAPRPFTICDIERHELWAAYRASLERACQADSECVVVISPSSFVRELATVVHTLDSAALVARAGAHLDQCGAFSHYEPSNAIRVVEAVCGQGHCAERETILHVED